MIYSPFAWTMIVLLGAWLSPGSVAADEKSPGEPELRAILDAQRVKLGNERRSWMRP
jgi:hypothetical protein